MMLGRMRAWRSRLPGAARACAWPGDDLDVDQPHRVLVLGAPEAAVG